MKRRYWWLRAAWARWRTRNNPRPSLDDLLGGQLMSDLNDGMGVDG